MGTSYSPSGEWPEWLERARETLRALIPNHRGLLDQLRPVAHPAMPMVTMMVDDRLRVFYHPKVAEAFSPDELCAVLYHEVEHFRREHHARSAEMRSRISAARKDRYRSRNVPNLPNLDKPDVARWVAMTENVSMDAEINCSPVFRSGLLTLPEAAITPEKFGEQPGSVWERYFWTFWGKVQEEERAATEFAEDEAAWRRVTGQDQDAQEREQEREKEKDDVPSPVSDDPQPGNPDADDGAPAPTDDAAPGAGAGEPEVPDGAGRPSGEPTGDAGDDRPDRGGGLPGEAGDDEEVGDDDEGDADDPDDADFDPEDSDAEDADAEDEPDDVQHPAGRPGRGADGAGDDHDGGGADGGSVLDDADAGGVEEEDGEGEADADDSGWSCSASDELDEDELDRLAEEQGVDGAPRELVDAILDDAAEGIEERVGGKNRGVKDGAALRHARWRRESRKDYLQVLSKYVGRAMTTLGQTNYTWTRPSRRADAFAGSSGYIPPKLVAQLPTICVVIDSSGSITDDMINTSWSEAMSVARTFGPTMCIVGDTGPRKVITIGGRTNAALGVGRGGTDMPAIFEYALKHFPGIECLVCYTDGETAWPAKRLPVPLIVCLIGDYRECADRYADWKDRDAKRRYGVIPAWADVIVAADPVIPDGTLIGGE